MSLRAYILTLLAILALLALLALVSLPSRFNVYPTPETTSGFFKAYDPLPALNPYRSGCNGTSTSTGGGSSAGSSFFASRRDVEHTRFIDPNFCGDPSDNPALLTTLQSATLAALQKAACQVSESRLNLDAGLHIAYRCGERTRGLMTAKAPVALRENDTSHFILSVNVTESWGASSGAD